LIRSSLDAHPANDMAFGGARFVFQEEITLEEGEVWEDDEVSLVEMDKDGDLENGDQIQLDKLNLEMIEQAVIEITCGKPESVLEEGFGKYDCVSIRDWDVFVLSRLPLEDGAGRKKVVID
jgi:hypothetical protein